MSEDRLAPEARESVTEGGSREGLPRRPRAEGWLDLAVPLLATAALLLFLDPGLAFRGSIPAGTDLPGHLLPQQLLAEDLLPAARIRGWAPEWFTGFPLFWFYFPLPSVVGAVLGSFLGGPLALRVVALLPPIALPWVVYAFVRASGFSTPARIGAVVVGTGFLFTTSFYALGGNLLSTFVGEFTYGWSLDLSLLYLALLVRDRSRSGRGFFEGVVLGAAFLSHLLPAVAAASASTAELFRRRARSAVFTSWVVAGALTAFWFVPLAFRFDLVGRPGWEYVPGLGDIFPIELLLLLPAALIGIHRARPRQGVVLLGAVGAFALLLALVPQPYVVRGRLLPLWFLVVHIFAGIGIGIALREGMRALRNLRAGTPEEPTPVGGLRWRLPPGSPALVAVVPLLVLLGLRSLEPITTLRDHVLSGMDAVEGNAELAALRDRLVQLPPGRLHWEDHETLERWGGPYAFALLPLSTPHNTLGGLLAESSPVSELARLADARLASAPQERPYRDPPEGSRNVPRGIDQLRLLGVRYFVAISPETAAEVEAARGARSLARFGELELFDLGEQPLVVALPCAIEFSRMLPSFRAVSTAWFEEWEPGAPYLVHHPDPARAASDSCGASRGEAEILRQERHLLRFRATARGVPHLVRVGFFPNWKAEGAAGPYRVSPHFMVVIPENEIVTLSFGITRAEISGWAVSLAFGAIVLMLWGREQGVRTGINPVRAMDE